MFIRKRIAYKTFCQNKKAEAQILPEYQCTEKSSSPKSPDSNDSDCNQIQKN
jgi:nitrate/TMAO reductase-like tetraheme cytochrome c subunit